MRWILAVVSGLGGLAVLAAGVQLGLERRQLYRDGAHTRGTVVDLVEHEVKGHKPTSSRGLSTMGMSTYYPVVEFQTESGKKVHFGGEGSRSPGKFAKNLALTPRALSAKEQKALDDQYGTAANNPEVLVGRSDGVKNSVYTIASGATVDVVYDARDPSKAQIGSLSQLFLRPLVMMLVGFALLAFSMRAFFVPD